MTPVADSLSQQIARGCAELDLHLEPHQQQLLNRYIQLLEKWNRAYNLSAVREPSAMVPLHLLDSLAIQPWLGGARCLDVGTGAGLPGIPLAIANPETRFTLLDSNGKKVRFLTQVVAELGLENVTPIQQRSQQLVDKAGFDMVLSRAFASLRDMVEGTAHLLAPAGRWLAMKGAYPQPELQELPSQVELLAAELLRVPNLTAQRHLIILGRKQSS